MKQNCPAKTIAELLLIICLLVTGLCSCSSFHPPQPPPSSTTDIAKVRVVATRDFGHELLFDEVVEIEDDTSAMDALDQVADLETAYGGEFVDSINGISSGYKGNNKEKKDWFFYINGICSNAGAGKYILRHGDVEHWDFRDWSYLHFVPTIIGDFPQPFVSGGKGKARKTIVVYEDWLEESVQSLPAKLNDLGIKEVSVQSYSQLSEDSMSQYNLILLASKDNELISNLNNAHNKLGFYAYFHQGRLVILNAGGNVAREYSRNCGIIQATQNPWNPKGTAAGENVVWIISGTDEAGVKSAIDALMNHQANLKYAHSVIITNGEIIKVP